MKYTELSARHSFVVALVNLDQSKIALVIPIGDSDEDANHNGRIDGDNGDGTLSESETWTESSPNLADSDGDTFTDKQEKTWGYNPLSKDTDGDGLDDNVEDSSNAGTKDSTETSAIDSDTDGDGLTDKMEIDGWTVIIILEATLEIDEERDVTSDPLIADYDQDGINDCGEFENGTDPNDDDTDDDGQTDYQEINGNFNSSPTGVDGTPPEVWHFECSYEENFWNMDPIKLLSGGLELEVEVGVKDLFGIEAITVDIRGLEDRISFGHGLDNVTKTFEWSINSPSDYEKVLFDGFNINISIFDNNDKWGYPFNSNRHMISINHQLLNNMVQVNGIMLD